MDSFGLERVVISGFVLGAIARWLWRLNETARFR
jgi:hypothetical protein